MESFHGYSITSNSDKNSVSGNVMYPFDLKNAGATRAEMLALKNNDAGECVCACFDVMISHGWPAKLPRRCSFFLSVLSFLFSFFLFYNAFGLVRFSSYKDQC